MAHAPQRMCVGCGARRPQAALSRLTVTADGQPVLDRAVRSPGRGAYLCGPGCLAGAVKRKAFQRAFRGRVQVLESEALAAALRTVKSTATSEEIVAPPPHVDLL